MEIIPSGNCIVLKNVMSGQIAPPPAGYASRLEYWEKATGLKSGKCSHEVCNRPATEGGLARRAFSSDRRMFVYPACETCARRTEMLYVEGPIVELTE